MDFHVQPSVIVTLRLPALKRQQQPKLSPVLFTGTGIQETLTNIKKSQLP